MTRLTIYLQKSASMLLQKKAMEFSVPKGFNSAKVQQAVQEMIGQKRSLGKPFRHEDQVMNCATGTCYALSKGGVKIHRNDSLSPYHPAYSERYRNGARATQMGPQSPTVKGMTFKPAVHTEAPEIGKDVVLHQRVHLKKDWVTPEHLQEFISGQSRHSAEDLYDSQKYVEHVLPVYDKGGVPHVFDIRSKNKVEVPYADYVKKETQPGRIVNYLGRVEG